MSLSGDLVKIIFYGQSVNNINALMYKNLFNGSRKRKVQVDCNVSDQLKGSHSCRYKCDKLKAIVGDLCYQHVQHCCGKKDEKKKASSAP